MLERARPDKRREASGLLRQAELPLEARERPSGIWCTSRSCKPDARRSEQLGCLQARSGSYEVWFGVPGPQGMREVALCTGGCLHPEAGLPELSELRAGSEAADARSRPPEPSSASRQEDSLRRSGSPGSRPQ